MHIFLSVDHYRLTILYLPFGLVRDDTVNDSEEDQKVVVKQVTDYKYDE